MTHVAVTPAGNMSALITKKNADAPIWQIFGFKPDQKGELGKLEVWCLAQGTLLVHRRWTGTSRATCAATLQFSTHVPME